uniref:ShKT domain-containing protein n=1 Tax=Acrobeloides nanus TaxID=290746 RepID=A0A914DJW0_9BILA
MIEECPLSCGYCNLTSTTTTTTTTTSTTSLAGFAMDAVLETQTCDSLDVFLLVEDGVVPIFSTASGSMSEPITCLNTNGDEVGNLFCIRSLPESIAGLLPLPVDGDSLVDVSSITYKSCDNFCACHKDGDCYEDLNMYSGNYKLVPVCEDNTGTKCCMLIYFTSQEDTAGLINIETGRAYFANATFYSGLSFVRFDCSGTIIPAVNAVSCKGCASIHYPTCQNQQIAIDEERQNPRINKKNRKNGGRDRINNRDRDVNSNKKNRENSPHDGIESSNDWRKRIFG